MEEFVLKTWTETVLGSSIYCAMLRVWGVSGGALQNTMRMWMNPYLMSAFCLMYSFDDDDVCVCACIVSLHWMLRWLWR